MGYISEQELNTTLINKLNKINNIEQNTINIGDKNNLKTTSKDNLVQAINEVFTCGVELKKKIVDKLNAEGNTFKQDDSWDNIINNMTIGKYKEGDMLSVPPIKIESKEVLQKAKTTYYVRDMCIKNNSYYKTSYIYEYVSESTPSYDKAPNGCYIRKRNMQGEEIFCKQIDSRYHFVNFLQDIILLYKYDITDTPYTKLDSFAWMNYDGEIISEVKQSYEFKPLDRGYNGKNKHNFAYWGTSVYYLNNNGELCSVTLSSGEFKLLDKNMGGHKADIYKYSIFADKDYIYLFTTGSSSYPTADVYFLKYNRITGKLILVKKMGNYNLLGICISFNHFKNCWYVYKDNKEVVILDNNGNEQNNTKSYDPICNDIVNNDNYIAFDTKGCVYWTANSLLYKIDSALQSKHSIYAYSDIKALATDNDAIYYYSNNSNSNRDYTQSDLNKYSCGWKIY